MNCRLLTLSIISIFLFASFHLSGQDPTRFENEIQQLLITIQYDSTKSNTVVFTGSSSIKSWKNINEYFPEHNIINTGFGGSQMSDLLYYSNQLILNFNPSQVFIYEGD